MLDVEHIASSIKAMVADLVKHARDEVTQHVVQIDGLKIDLARAEAERDTWKARVLELEAQLCAIAERTPATTEPKHADVHQG